MWPDTFVTEFTVYYNRVAHAKKSLKIPKMYSEAVNGRRTDKTTANRKNTIRQTMIYKTLPKKVKIEQRMIYQNWGMHSVVPEV